MAERTTRAAGRRAERPLFYRVCYDAPPRRRGLRWLGLVTLALTLAVAFFSAQSQLLPLDRELSEAFQAVESPLLTTVSDVVSFPGFSPYNFALALGIAVAVGIWLHWQVGLYVAVVTAVQGLATVLFKFPIKVPRPEETDLNAPIAAIEASSFPSGHTTMYVVLFGFVVYLLYRHGCPSWLRTLTLVVAGILIALVGMARVHLGAHWIGDVLVAYVLGGFLLLLTIEVYERYLLPRLDLPHDEWDEG